MNIKEFSKPITAKSLNESLAKRFGERIAIDKFTTEQLQDARNKLRTKLSQVETTESFNVVKTESYQKSKMFLDVLNAAIAERGESIVNQIDEAIKSLKEGKEDEAQLVMAAKDMVDRLTGWMEDTAEMQTESMLELADSIRDEMGQEKADQFVQTVKPALDALYQTMESTRETLTSGVTMLTGEGEIPTPMGADDMGDLEPEGDMGDIGAAGDTGEEEIDLGLGDEFGASGAAAGGTDLEGRAKRESVEFNSKKPKAKMIPVKVPSKKK